MQTHIYTTKKLEKFIRKLVKYDQEANSESSGILGDWSATLFFVDRKKCLLFQQCKSCRS